MSALTASLFTIFCIIISTTSLPNSDGHKLLTFNKIAGITTSCNSKFFNITIKMEKPFKGVLFAREFSQKCKSFGKCFIIRKRYYPIYNILNFIGNFSKSLVLSIPTSGCGISFGRDEQSQRMYYLLTIVLQQDRFLRQISDEIKKLKCYVEDEIFQVKSKNMEFALKNLIYDANHRYVQNYLYTRAH